MQINQKTSFSLSFLRFHIDNKISPTSVPEPSHRPSHDPRTSQFHPSLARIDLLRPSILAPYCTGIYLPLVHTASLKTSLRLNSHGWKAAEGKRVTIGPSEVTGVVKESWRSPRQRKALMLMSMLHTVLCM